MERGSIKRAAFVATSVIAAGQIAYTSLTQFAPQAQAQKVFPLSANPSGTVQDVLNPTGGYFNVWNVASNSATVSACGLTPSIIGNNQAGQVTMGTGSVATCTITFASAYVSAPICVVEWATNLTLMNWVTTTNTILLTQTGTASTVVDYICFGRVGG